MNWLSNLSQSERKIDLTNRWIVQLSISRTDENSVPRGSGKGDQLSDNVVMEKCVVIDSAAEIDNEYVGPITSPSFYPEEVVQLQVEEDMTWKVMMNLTMMKVHYDCLILMLLIL